MQHEIHNRPTYASLHLVLEPDEEVVLEAGAMMGMSPGLKVKTSMSGGLRGAFSRWMTGESMFLNTYRARAPGQRLDVAPPQPGDLVHIEMRGQSVVCQQGAYCASTPNVTINAKWAGLRSVLTGEGSVMIQCRGEGHLWLASYGAIHEVAVNGTCIVDTGHIVAFEESLNYFPKPVGGVKSTLYSGEGMVMQFSGEGRLWLQTRCAEHFADFLHPFRRRRWFFRRWLSYLNPFRLFRRRRRVG